jgi:hypothetical protein
VRRRSAGPALAVLVAALPLVLLPSLAWGVGGRVTAVEVPADLRSVAALLSDQSPGSVGVLPWSQYRRYGWNGSRVSLTLVPRMVDQDVVLDDGLPLAEGVVPGEDPVARSVGERITQGVPPLQALTDAGVRWVLVEKDTGLPDPLSGRALPPTARVAHDGPTATLIEVAPAAGQDRAGGSASSTWGWIVTGATWLVALGCVAARWVRRPRSRLIQSPPWLLGSQR